MTGKSHHAALPDGHALHWYRLQRVLGQGAFGITYLALDVNLDRLVAIKEYMPSQLATRTGDLTIIPLSEEHRSDFKWGLTRFVDEARVLTRFEHRNLVRVVNVFELHGSAYMVMNYEQGESLQEVLKREKTLPERRLLQILLPLMSGMELIHERGFVHRDIKPGNIYIREDGSPVLLDFGSARQTRGHPDPQTLTTLVSPGYAPIEQYISKSDRQGPWTDIYALGATLYRAVAGIAPSAATDRSAMLTQGMQDDLQRLSKLAADRYSEKFLAAVDHALAFRIEDRPQSVGAWRREFDVNQDEIDTQPDAAVDAAEVITEPLTEKTTQLNPAAAPAEQSAESGVKTASIAPGDAVHVDPIMVGVAPAARPAWGRRAVIAAVLAVLALATVKRVRKAEEPAPEPGAVVVQPVPEATAMAAPNASPTEMPQEGGSNAARIAELLGLAEQDMTALRLMSPPGQNAYERYQEVLTLEPDNAVATAGLTAISQRYVDLGYGAMNQGKLDDAAGYLIRAGRVEPPAETLTAAKAALTGKLQEARKSAAKQSIKDARRSAAKRRQSVVDDGAVPVEERRNPPPGDRVKRSPGD